MAKETKKRKSSRRRSSGNGGWTGMFLRLLASTATVMLTYNPSGYSFYHWVVQDIMGGDLSMASLSVKLFALLALLIPWIVIGIATKRSLGVGGILLIVAFFIAGIVTLVLNFDVELGGNTIIWLTLAILSLVLAIGLSWSIIRRKITGQVDIDRVDDGGDDDYHHHD